MKRRRGFVTPDLNHARIVDDDLYGAECAFQRGYQILHCVGASQVGGPGEAVMRVGAQFFQAVIDTIGRGGDRHLGPGRLQQPCGRKADAIRTSCPRHQSDAA